MAVELISQIWQLFCITGKKTPGGAGTHTRHTELTGHPDGEERVNFDRCEGPGSSILSC